MQSDIRPARASDLDALVAIEVAAFESDRISRRSFRRLLASPSAAIKVAELAGKFAGYTLVLYRTGSRRARLYSIATAHPGRGLGPALLAAAERDATLRACTMLGLEVRAGNAHARTLYERNGFRLAGELPGYYADGAAAIRYEKALVADEAQAA